jgi:hypothetical protein
MANDNSDSCPILTGPENFQIWKLRVAARLRRNKVYGHVTGITPKPTFTPAAKDTPATKVDGDSWDILDAKAHGILMDTIDDNTAMQVGDLATSKEVYDAIIRIYEGTNTDSTAFYTWVEMMNIAWDGSSPIGDHIAKIRACERRLAAVKRPVDSAITAYLLLHSLPSDNSWSSFTASVLNSLPPNTQLTFATVETRLLAEAARVMSSNTKAEAALKVTKSSKLKHCDRHGKCSHSTAECNVLKAERRQKGEKGKNKGKAHHAGTASDDESDTLSSDDVAQANHVFISKGLMKRIHAYAAVLPNLKRDIQILDSGCTRHMFPRRGEGMTEIGEGFGTSRSLSGDGWDVHPGSSSSDCHGSFCAGVVRGVGG